MYRLLAGVALLAMCALAQQPPRDRCKICLEITGIAATAKDLADFEHKGHTVCQGLHQDERHECVALMMHAKQIFEAEHGPDHHTPQEICQHIHACTAEMDLAKLDELAQPEQFGVGCSICESLIGYAEKQLAANATEKEIEQFLENNACAILPGFLKHECDTLIEQYLPKLVQALVNKEPPAKACASIGLCSALKEKAPEPVQFFPGECTICEEVIKEAESLVTSSTTEGELTHILDDLCKKVPFVGGLCEALVDAEVPKLLQLLKDKEPPSKVCKTIHACSTDLLRNLPNFISKCSICEHIADPVIKGVESNESEAAIEAVIDTTVCPELDFFAPVCVALCKEFVPKMINELKGTHVTGQELCHKVHLC